MRSGKASNGGTAMAERFDLRSDFISRPTEAMVEAMVAASAEMPGIGFREDPVVSRLEALSADLLGKEDALFCPTCTLCNQIAVNALCRPGDSFLVPSKAPRPDHRGRRRGGPLGGPGGNRGDRTRGHGPGRLGGGIGASARGRTAAGWSGLSGEHPPSRRAGSRCPKTTCGWSPNWPPPEGCPCTSTALACSTPPPSWVSR